MEGGPRQVVPILPRTGPPSQPCPTFFPGRASGRRAVASMLSEQPCSPSEGRAVKRAGSLALVLVALLVPSRAGATVLPRPFQLERLNRKLHGKVVDHTHNHGSDRRI